MSNTILEVSRSLMQAKWVVARHDDNAVARIIREHSLPEIVARLLHARNVAPEQVESFLYPKLSRDFPDPLKLAGMKELADYLAGAVANKRRIGVFGDFDVDGATS